MTVREPFKVESGVVLKSILLSPSGGWPVWTVVGAGIILICIGIIADVRWLAIGLMVCLAVAPGIVAIRYFSHILKPDVIPNMIPHTLERTDNGYILRMWHRTDSEDTEETEEWVETGKVHLNDSNITHRKTSFEYEALYFRDSSITILYLPRFKK